MSKLLVLISLLFCVSCNNQAQYIGDGSFTDNGAFSAKDRYVLDLGTIDFTSSKSYNFSISDLPKEEFTFGFKIVSHSYEEKAIIDTKPINPLIKMVLINDRDELVINTKEYLKNWVWSGAVTREKEAFVYLRGEEIENSNPTQFTGFLADGGWGTYFSPKKKASYKLSLEIVEGATNSTNYGVTLLAKGGGWK